MERNLDLLNRPLFTLTVEEFMNVQQSIEKVANDKIASEPTSNSKYVYGYKGIAQLFGCSIPTASRIKLSGKIDGAIRQIGRKIIVDAEKALELVNLKNGGRR